MVVKSVANITFTNERDMDWFYDNVGKYPHIDGWGNEKDRKRFLNLVDENVYVVFQLKYDGSNLRIYRDGDEFVVITKRRVAEDKYVDYIVEAVSSDYRFVKFLNEINDGECIAGEIIHPKNCGDFVTKNVRAMYKIFEIKNDIGRIYFGSDEFFGIFAYECDIFWGDEVKYWGENKMNEFVYNIVNSVYINGYEGLVAKIVNCRDMTIKAQIKVKPFHFGIGGEEYESIYSEKKKYRIKKKVDVDVDLLLECAKKVKREIGERDFDDKNIAIPKIIAEYEEESGKEFPKKGAGGILWKVYSDVRDDRR